MANMTFKANLLPNTDLGYSLSSENQRWKINEHTINASIDAGTKDRITYYSDDDIISPSINMKNIVDVNTSINTK